MQNPGDNWCVGDSEIPHFYVMMGMVLFLFYIFLCFRTSQAENDQAENDRDDKRVLQYLSSGLLFVGVLMLLVNQFVPACSGQQTKHLRSPGL